MTKKDNITSFEAAKGEPQKSSAKFPYGEVIRKYRANLKMAAQDLAKEIGVSKNTLSHWEAGRVRPDIDLLPALCKTLGITYYQFFEESDLIVSEQNYLSTFRALNPVNQRLATKLTNTLLEDQLAEHRVYVRNNVIRLFLNDAKTAAGIGAPLADRTSGNYVYLYSDDDTSRADEIITVTGNSMEPTFHDGDALLVEHTQSIRPGEIGIFVAHGEGYVKEYQADGLHSHNPDYSVLHFNEDDNVHCVGRVLSALRPEQYASAEDAAIAEDYHRKHHK